MSSDDALTGNQLTDGDDGGFFADDADEEDPRPRRERRRDRRKKKGRRGRGVFSFLAVVLSLAVVGALAYGAYTVGREWLDDAFAPAADYEGPGHGSVEITIPRGATHRQMGNILFEADVVASVEAFVDAATEHPQGRSIQAGDYTMMHEMSAADAVEALLNATAVVGRVTIPEGLRIEQAAARIADATDFDEDQVLAALEDAQTEDYAEGYTEGFLFPATYDIRPDTTPESLATQMANRFGQAAADVNLVGAAESLGYTPLELVTIASIIQREVRHNEDMDDVADVIYNRLAGDCVEHGVPNGLLQMDSTVHYAINSYDSVFTSDEERQTDSPYNTYRYTGLPPGPIAGPGEAALRAALSPSGEGYCYFVTVDLDTGETKFATTQAEHEANVAELRS